MIENIQSTAIILLLSCSVLMALFSSDELKRWFGLLVNFTFFASFLALITTILIRIWS